MAEFPAKKTRTTSDADKEGHVSTKTRRRHVRGRRGGLRDMPQMPLDILFEVCTLYGTICDHSSILFQRPDICVHDACGPTEFEPHFEAFQDTADQSWIGSALESFT